MRVPFVDLQAQYATLEAEIIPAVRDVLSRCNYILGDQVEVFERAFAQFIGTEFAIGVSSGIDALRLALAALDIGVEDEVVLPANTFIATALAVSLVGARPVLVDCDYATYNIDSKQIEAAITPKTKAIMPVHLTGQPADMDSILEIARKHNLYVIEDAAQAHGATYKGRSCGSMGIMGCFSFYPAKNLGAYGDGGIITTSDAGLAMRLHQLRNYGQRVKYEHVEKGMNARLDTIQATVLNVKLPYLQSWNTARANYATKYKNMLTGIGDIRFQQCLPESTHVYHLFIIQTEYRDGLQTFLRDTGIETGIHYPIPIHLQEAYADLGYAQGAFPVSEYLAQRILSLPIYSELTDDKIRFVVDSIRHFFI